MTGRGRRTTVRWIKTGAGAGAAVVVAALLAPDSPAAEGDGALTCTTAGKETRSCVISKEGSIPVLLLSGHGGDTRPGGALPRESDAAFAEYGDGEVTFTKGKPFSAFDGNTIEVTDSIWRNFGAKQKPYVVESDVARGFVDNNRRAAGAWRHFENGSGDAEAAYGLYHDKVAEFCKKIEKASDRALIVDVHGKGDDNLNRGTGEGGTISEASKAGIKEDFLKPLHDEVLRQGIYSNGSSFIPAGEAFYTDLEASESPFNGGYTTRHYSVEKLAGYDFAAVGGSEPVYYKSTGGGAGAGAPTGSLVTFPGMDLDRGKAGRKKTLDPHVSLAADGETGGGAKDGTKRVDGAGPAGRNALYADESDRGRKANAKLTGQITKALEQESPGQPEGVTYEPLLSRTESPCQVDALQLEMGPSLKNTHPERTGKAVAAAVQQYYEQRIKK
ncbi:hypothetical protein [Streptomyces winkii]|uniref:hypothetical protein n=1 Tax=Streptomyces winkii TaxID=3051178 RepID=UPI0028D8704A|nr:hypothetical protein [Streptomyces sp. DSM 40971]